MVALHRQYLRPTLIESLTDESKDTSGIDENLLFASEVDMNGALLKVNSPDHTARSRQRHLCRLVRYIPTRTRSSSRFQRQVDACLRELSALTAMSASGKCEKVDDTGLELSIAPVDEVDYCMRHVRHMESIVLQMLKDGECRYPRRLYRTVRLRQVTCSRSRNQS